jgi:hypothetical protein
MVAIRRFPARCGVAAPTALPLVVLRLLRLVVAGCGAGAPSSAFATNQPAVATVTPLATAPVAGPVTIRVFELHNLVQPSPYPFDLATNSFTRELEARFQHRR